MGTWAWRIWIRLSLVAPRRASIFPQISCWKVSYLQTQLTSVLENPQAKTALRKGSHTVSLQNWQETDKPKKTHLSRGLCVIHWGNMGVLVLLSVLHHPHSQSWHHSCHQSWYGWLFQTSFAGHLCRCSPTFWTTPDVQQFSVTRLHSWHWIFQLYGAQGPCRQLNPLSPAAHGRTDHIWRIPLSDYQLLLIRALLSSFQPIPVSRESFRTVLLLLQSLSDTWHFGSAPDSFISMSGHCKNFLLTAGMLLPPLACIGLLQKTHCRPVMFGKLSHIFQLN